MIQIQRTKINLIVILNYPLNLIFTFIYYLKYHLFDEKSLILDYKIIINS